MWGTTAIAFANYFREFLQDVTGLSVVLYVIKAIKTEKAGLVLLHQVRLSTVVQSFELVASCAYVVRCVMDNTSPFLSIGGRARFVVLTLILVRFVVLGVVWPAVRVCTLLVVAKFGRSVLITPTLSVTVVVILIVVVSSVAVVVVVVV